MDFKQYIKEKDEKSEDQTAVMAFGRFNPPTVGHEQLIQKVHSVAKEHKGTAHIVASHSQGTMKDPLPQDKKLNYLHSISPGGVEVSGSSKEAPSIFHVASRLHNEGNKHLVIVAGSDRVDEYKTNLEKYNGVQGKHGYYNFKSIKVVSAGQRDPDAEGVEGMSGTKMREHARQGKTENFKAGLPDALKAHAEEIVNHIKAVKEDYENPYRFDWGTPEGTEYMKKMTPGMKTECGVGEIWSKEKGMCVPLREAYLNEEIFNLYDTVEATNGDKGEVVYRGSSYVTMQLNDGSTVKHWIQDIKESQEQEIPSRYFRNYRTEKKIPALLLNKKQLKEMTEGVDTADYEMRIDKDGTPYKVKQRIISDKKFSDHRRKKDDDKDIKEMYTGQRDVNYSDEKDITIGIDNTIPGQTVDNRPIGLVSFRTFMNSAAGQVAKEYEKETDSIRQRQMEIDALGHHMHHPQIKLRMSEED